MKKKKYNSIFVIQIRKQNENLYAFNFAYFGEKILTTNKFYKYNDNNTKHEDQ